MDRDTRKSQEMVAHPLPTLPASWTTSAAGQDEAYATHLRLEQVGDMGLRAVHAVNVIHSYIEETGPHHPAVEAELRLIEDVIAKTSRDVIAHYMRPCPARRGR